MIKISAINQAITEEAAASVDLLQGRKIKQVRHGVVVVKEVRVRRRRKETSAMRQAVKLMQRKAHTPAAERKRAKSLKVRQRLIHSFDNIQQIHAATA